MEEKDVISRQKMAEKNRRRRRERRIQIIRRIGIPVGILLVVIVFAVHGNSDGTGPAKEEGATQTQEKAETNVEEAATQAQEKAETNVEETSFESILEAESTGGVTLTWEGLTKEEDAAQIQERERAIEEVIGDFTEEEHSTAFLLYDINTGGGISYRADAEYYSASIIKGPYVGWIAQAYPEWAQEMFGTIANTIRWSSDEDYFTLAETFGFSEFNPWVAGLGCQNIVVSGEWFPTVTAREFTLLWQNLYQGITSGTISENISELYTDTVNSCIAEALGGQYQVYSKAGWIGEGLGTYYHVQNDAGFVMKEENPYILVILSDAYERMDLLQELTKTLDRVHTELVGE